MEDLNKNKLIVGYDLHQNLKLYNVPFKFLNYLSSKHKNIIFKKITSEKNKSLKDIEIYFGNRITEKIIKKSPKLKWIHFGSIGIERANIEEVQQRKIIVTNSKGTMEKAIASSAMAFILYFSRGLHNIENLRKNKNLSRKTFDKYFDNISDLNSLTCLIVGKGNSGIILEKNCKSFNMNVISIKKNVKSNKRNRNLYLLNDLPKLILKSDFVVNLLPLTSETKKIFNRDIFKIMKKTSYFINLGRGGTVVEKDLINALKSKKILGAALDVFENEPLSKDSELWNIPNLVITPHIAGLHNKYWENECALFAENLERYTKSKSLLNVVNLNKGY